MDTIYFNQQLSDDGRRARLYNGQLFIYSARPSAQALCQLARDLAGVVFAPHDPREAQHHLDVDRYVEILARLKPRFIHHPKAKECIREILEELDCDLNATFFDVPRLRTSTSDEYLTAGMGYAFKPHRDTWYSTPMCENSCTDKSCRNSFSNPSTCPSIMAGKSLEGGQWRILFTRHCLAHVFTQPEPEADIDRAFSYSP